MYELSVALKYLIPRRRQLSVSIISMISIMVIALVVWLILIFFSVKNGLEKMWVEKLTALTAPVRVTPTDAYYNSYYYLVDSISVNSNYTPKSIGEKLASSATDPYDPSIDEEIPDIWSPADLNPDGSLKDLAQLAMKAIDKVAVSGIKGKDFEIAFGSLRLGLVRGRDYDSNKSYLNQGAYLGSFDPDNSRFNKTLIPFSRTDFANLLAMAGTGEDGTPMKVDLMRPRLKAIFQQASITRLKTPPEGWRIPKGLLPSQAEWKVLVLQNGVQVAQVIIPPDSQGIEPLLKQYPTATKGTIRIAEKQITLETEKGQKIKQMTLPLTLAGNSELLATLDPHSIEVANQPGDLRFLIEVDVQGSSLKGKARYDGLEPWQIAYLNASPHSFWVYKEGERMVLPHDPVWGEGIILPKNFREAGVLLGDRGSLSYYTPTTSTVQEQQIPVYVAGFYDQGIMPIGGKFLLTGQDTVSLLRSSYDQNDNAQSTGINVRFDDLGKAPEVKKSLEAAFLKEGIAPYWKIETYGEYEFTKDLIQQLNSEKNIFGLVSMIIIVVACSNIISMLIILVNDKRVEIGILRAMGATSLSIAAIFGLCGFIMGLLGSLTGIGLALLTLHYLQPIMDFLGRMQGHQVFNALFYGDTLPNQLSVEALSFVFIATVLISLISGIVPAVKASLMRPSAILRSE